MSARSTGLRRDDGVDAGAGDQPAAEQPRLGVGAAHVVDRDVLELASAPRWPGSSKIAATTSRQPVIFVHARSVTTSRSCAISAPSASSVPGNRVESVTSRVASVRSERNTGRSKSGRRAHSRNTGRSGSSRLGGHARRGRRRRAGRRGGTTRSRRSPCRPPASASRTRVGVGHDVASSSRPRAMISARLGREWRQPGDGLAISSATARVVGRRRRGRACACARRPAAGRLVRAEVGELALDRRRS